MKRANEANEIPTKPRRVQWHSIADECHDQLSPGPLSWRFDDFVLDARQYELQRNGGVVRLEPQVFDVLVYLVANHPHVVSRHEVLDAIWGIGRGSDASLSTRVKEARRGLGDTGKSQRYIRTVRGHGYQFAAATMPTTTESATEQPEEC